MNDMVALHVEPRYSYIARVSNAESAMNTIRQEMYSCDVEHMSVMIGVSVSCLYAIRCGRTTWPRPKTFFGLIDYLDLDMTLSKKQNSSGV